MASKAAIRRLTKEAQLMEKDPPPFVFARPREDNILEWHYILRGPPDTPYAGGEYHGQLIFPPSFPFAPPAIKMSTPSGRFKPDTKICTSMSDYHPHTWQPGWNTSTILIGLLSFMCSDEMTTGSVTASDADRRTLATRSHEHNIKQKRFVQIFPEWAGAQIKDLPNMGHKEGDKDSAATGGRGPGATAAGGSGIDGGLRTRQAVSPSASGGEGAGQPATPTPPASASASAAAAAAAARGAGRPRQGGADGGGRGGGALGARSSLIVLALLAYLFFSRIMSGGGGGGGGAAAGAGK